MTTVSSDTISQAADQLVERIDALPSCADLQGLLDEQLDAARARIKAELDDLADMTTDYFKGLIDGLGGTLEMLAVLKEIPTDLDEVIEWITSMVSGYVKQFEEAVAALEAIPVEFARVTDALAAKIGGLSGCVPAMPSLPELPELPEIPV